MPGIESLNKLGKEGNEYCECSFETFLDHTLKELNQIKTLTSKDLLLAIHNVRIYIIADSGYKSSKQEVRMLMHVHDESYLKYFVDDFPDSTILAITKQPSVNIPRRIKSSYNEANKDKLSDVDYELTQLFGIPIYSKYYCKAVNQYQALDQKIIYIPYENIQTEEEDMANAILDKLKLSKFEPKEYLNLTL